MANRQNELFIGKEFLNIQGREIKHPALIKLYANLNVGKISNEMLQFIGIDLETNHKTAELMLLGLWNGTKYKYHYKENFIDILFKYIKYACDNNYVFAWWNKLDPFVLYKQFLLQIEDEELQRKSLEQYSKISGEWSKKDKFWKIPPVIEIPYKQYMFGIVTAVRGSIKFFYYDNTLKNIKNCWAYDIAGLYQNGLEKEATSRLDYYTKIDESAHLVDWERFENDKDFRENIVLKSNELDSRAVYDLAIQINDEFKRAFGYYPTNLVSQGSFARAALVATITNKYEKVKDDKKRKGYILDELKSINLMTHIEFWNKKYDKKVIQNMYQCIVESYSAGYIEAIRYGFTEKAYYADIASAYPGVLQNLYDLTNSEITYGKGVPPNEKYSYCFIRGLVDIPEHLNFIPLTIKHPVEHSTNIRATGKYYASYTLDERIYLEAQGAKFNDEHWFNIKTKGKLSSIAEVTKQFVELRLKLLAAKDSAQYSAKIAANSLYGIEFEAVPVYEVINGEIEKVGYRAGEFFNPLYATIITARTRILLAKAAQSIENKGGEVILLMTDSVFWKGTADMLPTELWREQKTLGYFEKPDEVQNMCCLGSGRYEYMKDNEKYEVKKRGLNAVDIHDPYGIPLDTFSYYKALKMAANYNLSKIKVKVRRLVSVGTVLSNYSYSVSQLGLVTNEERDVELVVGWNKRIIPLDKISPKILIKNLIKTDSIYLDLGYNGKNEYYDGTLPILRNECNKLDFKSRKEKEKKWNQTGSKNYYDNNRIEIRANAKNLYALLREAGFSTQEAKKYSNRSYENVMKLISDKQNSLYNKSS